MLTSFNLGVSIRIIRKIGNSCLLVADQRDWRKTNDPLYDFRLKVLQLFAYITMTNCVNLKWFGRLVLFLAVEDAINVIDELEKNWYRNHQMIYKKYINIIQYPFTIFWFQNFMQFYWDSLMYTRKEYRILIFYSTTIRSRFIELFYSRNSNSCNLIYSNSFRN